MVILTSFPPPSVGIRHTQPNTIAHVQASDLGKGTLYIAESRVSWVSEAGQGFSLEYPAISLHAVSRDVSTYPHDCLYLLLDAKIDELTTGQPIDHSGDADLDDDDRVDVTEIRFIPEDATTLECMFHSMSECQALHPDPADSVTDEDESEDDSNFEDAEEDSATMGIQNVNLGDNDLDDDDDFQESTVEPLVEGTAQVSSN